MAKMFAEWLQVILSIPRPVWAVLAGMLMAWAITQRIKFLLDPELPAVKRQRFTQVAAFLAGALTTLLVWSVHPDGLKASWDGVIVAALVGLWSPASYWLLVRWFGKRYPELRERLSQDVRSPPGEP